MAKNDNLINLNESSENALSEKEDETKDKKTPSKTASKSFRMISKIEPQKRKGRYNVYVNDEFAFGVDEEVLIRFELKKGLHITQKFQNKIENEDSFYKAYQKTLNYLSYSLRTEKQIRDYLFKNELGHFNERIIEKLKTAKLVDDLNYAQSYVRSKANVNQKGPRNIEQELYQKGVNEKDIMTALDEYPKEQEVENAIALAEKKWSKTKHKSEFETVQKIKQYLVNKGYSFEVADEAIAAIDTEKDEDEEYNALRKQAEKAHRRYARKHEGYELNQRLRRYLYSKGFSNELINRYFEEKDVE
jgi:regulatory protein